MPELPQTPDAAGQEVPSKTEVQVEETAPVQASDAETVAVVVNDTLKTEQERGEETIASLEKELAAARLRTAYAEALYQNLQKIKGTNAASATDLAELAEFRAKEEAAVVTAQKAAQEREAQAAALLESQLGAMRHWSTSLRVWN